MSLISLTNLITWLENHILTINKAEKKNQQWFNAKDEYLSILWKYILTIFLKHLNNLIY
jgi:hypothetical protein